MTYGDPLAMTVAATHHSIEERLGEALSPHHDPGRPRDAQAATDTFLAATSRHLAAVEEVLVDEVRHTVPDHEPLVSDYLEAARDLEQALALLKARLYGEAHAASLGWADLWTRVRGRLDRHNRLENELVARLAQHGEPRDLDGLARAVFEAETRAPTRPHPLLPHRGLLGHLARRVFAVADRFWDAAEGRVIPDPVKPRPHKHDSLMAQYLVADPKFDDHAEVFEHKHRHPESG
ncbi:hypothetical protein [Nocardioides iriomotensis]|uniref:Hemerythrin domain-containing protein n=1 Tax=Nocardioides iriomotensis TaxID=715784 RepID=A0A4Q5J5W5_9ACTN|nr:hypothetical protein [Nocardioides iriomotensis]RYU13021.1 hypothetical protein ETU37_08775 [Nocardioides iriomotensis]